MKLTFKNRLFINLRRLITLAILAKSSFSAFAYDWPQANPLFSSFFGQLRGSTISSSLIFSETSEIKACEQGKAILYIREYQDDTDFFPSTLGNALIISHSDNLVTIYGNLEKDSTSEEILSKPQIEKGEVIATSGDSSWHEGQSALELLVVDTKSNVSINPRLLMPRNVKEEQLYISGVLLQNRNGTFYDITKQNYLSAGSYRVYRKDRPWPFHTNPEFLLTVPFLTK